MVRLRYLAALAIAAPLVAQTPERHTLRGTRVAIYDLVGDVRIVEGTGRPRELPPDRFGGRGGPLAVVSSAEGSTLHAITFEHHDGGEGWVNVRWYSGLVDEARWCP